MGQWRFAARLTRKRKPRPGLGVAAFSPKQPAARRRRWRRAHFGSTGLKALPSPQRNGATNILSLTSPAGNQNPPEAPPDRREGTPRRESDPPEAPCQANRKEGAGHYASLARPAETCPPAGPAAQPSIEQPHVEIEAVTQAEEPSPSGPGGVRGAPPKRLTPLAVGSRAQPWSLFGYFLANQKVTPRRVGGQGIYIFSYVQA